MSNTSPKHLQERARLARLVFRLLRDAPDAPPSFNAMAAHCGVSRTTLRHYFQDATGALSASVEVVAQETLQGHPMFDAPFGDVTFSLHASLRLLVHGWTTSEIGALFRVGLQLGMTSGRLGDACRAHILEPTFAGFTRRLDTHVATGELAPMDTRTSAISLISPILLAMLHQHQLGGDATNPINLDALVSLQVDTFLQTWRQRVEES